MGMDVIGKKPQDDTGAYFRANVWSWRPLAIYCNEVAPEIAAKCKFWHTNDGAGLDSFDSITLSNILRRAIETGACHKYAEAFRANLDALPLETCPLCEGTGVRADMIVPDGCNGCRGNGRRKSFDTWYHFDVETVRDFSVFLRSCGGFEIW